MPASPYYDLNDEHQNRLRKDRNTMRLEEKTELARKTELLLDFNHLRLLNLFIEAALKADINTTVQGVIHGMPAEAAVAQLGALSRGFAYIKNRLAPYMEQAELVGFGKNREFHLFMAEEELTLLKEAASQMAKKILHSQDGTSILETDDRALLSSIQEISHGLIMALQDAIDRSQNEEEFIYQLPPLDGVQ